MTDEERTQLSQKRTQLAQERTRLAQERTVLAHIRTGFASFLFGIALLGLFRTTITRYTAYGFILLGILFLVTSGLSYLRSKDRAARKLRWRWRINGQDDHDRSS